MTAREQAGPALPAALGRALAGLDLGVLDRADILPALRATVGAVWPAVLAELGEEATAAKKRKFSDKRLALELARAFDAASPWASIPRLELSAAQRAWWLAVARRARELAKGGLLALALALPAVADAQTNAELLGAAEALRGLGLIPALADAAPGAEAGVLRHGVGWEPRDGARIRYAHGRGAGSSCPPNSQRPLRTAYEPWLAIGDSEHRQPATGLLSSNPEFRRIYCLRYEGGDASQECRCYLGGVAGDPHGNLCVTRLAEAFRRGLLGDPAVWDGEPNELERNDCINSEGEFERLNALLGIGSGPTGCGAGWRCTPLIELPEAERPPLATVRPYTGSAASDACSWYDGRGRTWVRSYPPCYEGLDATCQTVASLRPACWAPAGPVCGDGTCTAPEGPGSCPADCPPEPGVVEILDCTALGWRVRLPGGEVRLVALGAVVEAEGAAVRVPGVCAGECPAAEVLEAVRAVEGVCP